MSLASGTRTEPVAKVAAPGMRWWKWLLGPWMLVVTLAAFLHAGPAEGFQQPGAARIIFFHLPVALLMFVWFLVAAVHGIRFLRSGRFEFDRRSVTAAEIGLLCTILATVSGSVFAKIQWRTWWNWDPKQVGIVVVMFAYFAYFALRSTVEEPDRRARLSAVYALLAGVAAPFVMKGMQYVPAIMTLHPADTLQPGGMSSDYWTVFWLAMVGFFGVTLWLFELRLRVVEAAERIAERE